MESAGAGKDLTAVEARHAESGVDELVDGSWGTGHQRGNGMTWSHNSQTNSS